MPEDIGVYLNKIRTATYGQEVRGAIADGIWRCYEQVSGSEDFVRDVAGILEENTTTTVTQGQVGSDASVDVTREGTNLNFHFTIPQGNTGERGPVGPPPNISVTVHKIDDSEADPTVQVTGDPATPAIDIGLPKGPQGDQGPQGAIRTISLDSQELAYNSAEQSGVTVSYPIPGDTSAPMFHFKVKQGPPGAIDNANGETINITASDSTKIKDYIDGFNGFTVIVEFNSSTTQIPISDARIKADHCLTGYQFYTADDVKTGRILADISWTTDDGSLLIVMDSVHAAGSVVLRFAYCPEIDNEGD